MNSIIVAYVFHLVSSFCVFLVCPVLPAQLLVTLANLEGDETFEATMLGHAEEILQERISDDELILVKG